MDNFATYAIDTRDPVLVPVEAVTKESQAKMPTSVKSAYVRIAAMLMLKGTEPKMISRRASGCVRILKCSAPVPRKGSARRSGYYKATVAAEDACDNAPKTVPFRALTGRQQRLAAALAITHFLRSAL